MQYKAAFLHKTIFDRLYELRKKEQKLKIKGLLESISTFDVISSLDLNTPNEINPLLAVANNLITRGYPTLCSRHIFRRLDPMVSELDVDDIFKALHIVDCRPNLPDIYTEDLDSDFERAFLENIIPDEQKHLVQFLQHQRSMATLTNNSNDNRRVDFSFEDPYYSESGRTNRYQNNVNVKTKKAWIVEVDGARYHNNLIDDLRDYETGSFGHDTHRIRENSDQLDAETFFLELEDSEYFKTIKEFREQEFDKIKKIQTAVLGPVAIARIQKVINQYLISHYELLQKEEREVLNIAVIERDVPCGHLAITDLNRLYYNLFGLENQETFIPELKVTVFADEDFDQPDLQASEYDMNTDFVNPEHYDLVIDVSALWRKGIFDSDADYRNQPNTVVIRSSHFTESGCEDSILCAKSIVYRDLTRELGNEQHEEIEDALPYIEYFLQNIFYKEKFRKGQLPILNRALKNKTVIGLLPTGGGKSLTYQLAALLQPGITIVIDPIRSLMVDQHESLLELGISKSDFINSIQTREEKVFVQNYILPTGKTQFLFCSPERLVIQEFRDALSMTADNGIFFSYCVIDEAHCVSEWGHDFRTPYLSLGENVVEHCKTKSEMEIPIFGLTATASFDVLADIERELKIEQNDGNAIIRYENTVRDEINYQIHPIIVDEGFVTKNNIANQKLNRTETIIQNLNQENQLLLGYNNNEVYSAILTKSYHDYLPEAERDAKPEEEFIQDSWDRIGLTDIDLPFQNESERYNYGVIVFCPHRRGHLGVDHYYRNLELGEGNDQVYFKGSGNDRNQNNQDNTSFENLRKFKDNEASVMIATKAFGMGIDKPNVRATVHVNISSSIESFVQESGRVGRDGKTSLSVILYNNQEIENNGNHIYWDRDVLEYFYKNSFKGADKERSVMWELRQENPLIELNILNQNLNEHLAENLTLNLWKGNRAIRLYINDENGKEVSHINLRNKEYEPNAFYQELAIQVLVFFQENIPGFADLEPNQLLDYFQQEVVNNEDATGIENRLNEMDEGEIDHKIIPFQNQYYSKDEAGRKIVNENAFDKHYNKFKSRPCIEAIILNENYDRALKQRFRNAVKNNIIFEDFILSLNRAEEDETRILNDVKAKIYYYIPRSKDDTAKAIYRFSSLGIIDSYTIDYSGKFYTVQFRKKPAGTYLDNYQRLVGRYTSAVEAQRLKNECQKDINETKNATEISKCLKHLTDFVYEKIAAKRKRAIDDMINLCEQAIKIDDPFEQSTLIKDNIYYYFNAKYAREGNMALTENGEEISADLYEDFTREIPIDEVVWKYIEKIIPYDDNGQIINNLKHLRGATMRMLRGTSGAPQFNILKAFSLLALSPNTPDPEELIREAFEEMVTGFQEWNELSPETFDLENILEQFKINLAAHVEDFSEEFFENLVAAFYIRDQLEWLTQFNETFLKEYSNGDTSIGRPEAITAGA